MRRSERLLSERRAGMLARACRSTLGDRLRVVAYVEGDAVDRVYRRTDLPAGADADVVTAPVRGAAAGDALTDGGGVSTVGAGFRTRLPVGEGDVVVVSDGERMDRQRELRAVVRGLFTRS